MARVRVVGAGVGRDEDPSALPEPRARDAKRVIGSGGTAERPPAERRPSPTPVRRSPAKPEPMPTPAEPVAEGREVRKAWAGRFTGRTHRRLDEFTVTDTDRRLWAEDIAGSRAHARMLRAIGVLSADDWRAVDGGLRDIRRELAGGDFVFVDGDEDIHMAVERRLVELIGEPGERLHTARSRNDQVATDLRLWSKRTCRELMLALATLQEQLLLRAREHRATLIPGYTHLQRAQVVTVAHHLLAYVAMLQRDVERLEDCHERCDVMPLGSGALAGTTLPLDRRMVADALGFEHISHNSLDAVSDRDFAVELTAGCALVMVHLSRLAEEIVLWTTVEFGFATLPDAWATGSSLMPQKKNPDVLELVRGRVGRVVGAHVALLTTLKGLPLSYNRDLQEDKESLFAAVDITTACVSVMADVVRVLEIDAEATAAAAADPALMATDVVDHLVGAGVPFREAHHIVGRAVREAGRRRRPLSALTAAEWAAIDPRADAEITGLFDPERSLARRTVAGSPGPAPTRRALARAAAMIAKTRRLVTVMAGTADRARVVGAAARAEAPTEG